MDMLLTEAGTITRLAPQRRNKERVNVYLDGEFAFGLALNASSGLRVGQTLSSREIEKLQAIDTVEKAKAAAYRFLSYRPRSTAEVRKRLLQKGYDEQVVQSVIARLTELSLLDDAGFAAYWVEQREAFRPRSRRALRYELFQKGVSREIVEHALAELDETESARRAAERKLHQWDRLPRDEFFQKMQRYLRSRGFNYAVATEVTEEMWQAADADQEAS
jgi:regulatory protein